MPNIFGHPIIWALTLTAMSVSVASATTSKQIPDGPCAKSIKAIGPTIGHLVGVAPDGQSAVFGIVRTEGVEYVVRCDAATGMINDVSRRKRQDDGQPGL